MEGFLDQLIWQGGFLEADGGCICLARPCTYLLAGSSRANHMVKSVTHMLPGPCILGMQVYESSLSQEFCLCTFHNTFEQLHCLCWLWRKGRVKQWVVDWTGLELGGVRVGRNKECSRTWVCYRHEFGVCMYQRAGLSRDE